LGAVGESHAGLLARDEVPVADAKTTLIVGGHGECFIEIGGGRAAFGGGDFYAEPTPAVTFRPLSRGWHLGKVWVEKSWLDTKL
jgi:hypothetical protein